MHICPYCKKLGISTYAAIGDPFSRGLASCRYCHEVSKRHFRLGINVATPIAMLVAMAFVATSHPAWPLFALVFGILMFIALVIDDRLIDFEKRGTEEGKNLGILKNVARDEGASQ